MSEPTTKKRRADDDAPKLSFREHVRWLWSFWRPHRSILVFLALVADEVQALEWSLELRQRIEAEKKARQQARSEAA